MVSKIYSFLSDGLGYLSHLIYSLDEQVSSYTILPTTPILLRNTIFIGSLTFMNAFIIVIFFSYVWSMNRQTQIRKSKSQRKLPSKCDNDSNAPLETIGEELEHDSVINYETEPDCEEDDEDDDGIYCNSGGSIPKPSSDRPKNMVEKKKKELRSDLQEIASSIEVFSYLSSEAYFECLSYMEYVDLPRSGMSLLNKKEMKDRASASDQQPSPEVLDGSFYVVVSGEVTCTCDLNHQDGGNNEQDGLRDRAALTFTAGPGDAVTSLLVTLSGLVREYRQREHRNNSHAAPEYAEELSCTVRAVSSKNSTRLIRVPTTCFLTMLDKFPHDVHQIAHTILARTHRVTVQTLMKTMGLGMEALVSNHHDCPSTCYEESRRLSHEISSGNVIDKNKEEILVLDGICDKKVKHDAAIMAGIHLGANTPECIELIKKSSSLISIPPGHTLVEHGTKPDHIYLVLDGALEVGSIINSESEKGLKSRKAFHRKGSTSLPDDTSDYVNSSSFHVAYRADAGEMIGRTVCLVGNSIATIRTTSKVSDTTIVLQISKYAFDSLMDKRPSTLIRCLEVVMKEFSPVVHLLDWGIEWLHVQTGELIARKDEQCDSLFIVLNGRLRSGERGRNRHSVSHMGDEYGRGACIGDVQVLTGEEWPSDVYAIRNSELAMLPLTVLEVIMHSFPYAGVCFAKVIADQVQRKKKRVENTTTSRGLPSYGLSIATVAIVPLSCDLDVSEFSQAVVGSLGKIGPCKLMTKAIVRRYLGEKIFKNRNATHNLKMSRLLGDTEENSRLIVYQADVNFTWWTKTCLQHADCVLLVVSPDKAPELSRVEQYLSWADKALYPRRIHLVILQSVILPGFASHGTTAGEKRTPVSEKLNDWSERQPWITGGHQLVRIPFKTHPMDVNRMCRRITGFSVGLVLGGGGARGIAHLGVIRALLDAGVTVDMVGGTSQGAFIGALYAKSPDNFDELMVNARLMANNMSSIQEKVFDLTFPLVSYFNGKRFNKFIMQCFGKRARIQDLVLDFFCISTDLCKSSQVVHTKGLCWKYVRASMSLQGYLPPISEGGALLLDGGYVNLVPADVMSEQMGARKVIAVDVSTEEIHKYYEYGCNLSGFWLLWNSLNPFVKTVRVPSMGELSEKLIWVSAVKHLSKMKDCTDLFLSPPVENYGTLEYEKFDEIFMKGYDYATPRVQAFLKENPLLSS